MTFCFPYKIVWYDEGEPTKNQKKKQLIATAPSTELVLYEYILYFYFYCVFQY